MKIDEFVEKVNQVAYAKEDNDLIKVYSTKQPEDFSDWFLMLDGKSICVVGNYDWDCLDHLDSTSLFYILGLVQELKKTPIEERFPEKKWHLVIGNNEYGSNVYLMNVVGSAKPLRTCSSPNNDFATFTDNDLVALKEQYPRLAPAIDAMKEPVEDEE